MHLVLLSNINTLDTTNVRVANGQMHDYIPAEKNRAEGVSEPAVDRLFYRPPSIRATRGNPRVLWRLLDHLVWQR